MASFTREAIKKSFLKLLDERPLMQIKVKDIVEDCGINRNSFYYHYEDIPALLMEIVTEDVDRILREHASGDSLMDCVDAGVAFALKNKRAILHIYRSVERGVYEQHLMKICRHVVVAYADAVFGAAPISEEDRETLIRFYQCECFGQIIEWLNSAMSYDIQGQFHRLCQLREGMLEEMVRRCTLENGAAAQ
ncbi:TetR/AcrR family transcriptional regulator [Oscillibacter sp.]|uniref:TetR/AcrR family transcriptional regulator n=1 Tax=Oscillibacter sp. TaxID=1945593 RepID=UPI002613C7A4|nr:TetR/AcrR family transcriptional regulator [Oscillibacter sp.]MDD3346968.1 TetR-like C-terminal domain-containing protein [Oscillibacter sp.]